MDPRVNKSTTTRDVLSFALNATSPVNESIVCFNIAEERCTKKTVGISYVRNRRAKSCYSMHKSFQRQTGYL